MRFLLFAMMAVPLAAQPRAFATPDDLARMEETAARLPWAAQAKTAVIRAAEAWPQDHLQKYALKDLALPPEGGQWSLWYVCPIHGVSLRYRAPNTHTCPVDNRSFTGWPYDQVIWGRRHDDLAAAARNNALAYRMSGRREFAESAAWILNAYAAKYPSYPLHDKDNKNTRSGARASAQTLDEANWLIPLAWAYDLLAGSDVLTAEQRVLIESQLLREAVKTIERNDAGMSNWQTWHNTAIGAVGFTLNDAALIDKVIDGKSGFRYQMRESILGEGFWYEGSWGYHFYALKPLVWLAEMAARAGLDLYSEPDFRKLFELPLKFALPDRNLPAFNDSGTLALTSQEAVYEPAFNRYGDPLLASVLGTRARDWQALLWGAAELPPADPPSLPAESFPESGYAALRVKGSDHTLLMKFGPHGGWHGHYDKLSFVSFARGGVQGVDPGTQSYAAPTHDTWDNVTVSHNTVVVDEKAQNEAAGKLLWFASGDGWSAARADAGAAYPDTRLERTLFLTADYALDLYAVESADGKDRAIDWAYHNYGEVETDLTLADYSQLPKTAGYQHLSKARAASADGDWQMRFDQSASLVGVYGSVYASAADVQGRYETTREQAATGAFSAKASYSFKGAGYLLFSTPALQGQPEEVPSALRVAIFGDGSGHKLSLRINDATDERFVASAGRVDWTGWKTIEVNNPASWTHYLGNNNGIVDTPVKSVTLQLDQTSGGPAAGTLFVDDITLVYPAAGESQVAGFEKTLRNLRVWMLASSATTVVTGDGLGPDLLKPVPFVLARRRGSATLFESLIEPYGDAPAVRSFRRADSNTYVVTGPDWEDTIVFSAEGVLQYNRSPN